MSQVIINADDFGRSSSINVAVIRSHRQGVLTSASLMVTGDAFEEAVALARSTPTLAIGLHVVLAGGQAVLPPYEIPHLVDHRGRFPDNPAVAGLRYAFHPAARQELAAELGAQFERFAATGLPLSHVDGHLNLHLHPTVFALLVPLAERYGAHGVRLPRDDLVLALRHDRRHLVTKAAWAWALGLLSRWHLRKLRHRKLAFTERVYGVLQSGSMEEQYVVSVLANLSVATAELYFHPATTDHGEAWGPNPGDLATLLSPAVRRLIEERGVGLVTYAVLDQGA